MRLGSVAHMDVGRSFHKIKAALDDPIPASTPMPPSEQSTPGTTNTSDNSGTRPSEDITSSRPRVVQAEMSPEMMRREMERIREQSEGAGEGYALWAKCIRIAMRIVQGDNVTLKDDKFLAENEPELHMRAWMMRVPKDDPEDHESLLDDEEEKDAAEAAGVEAAPISSAAVDTAATAAVDIELTAEV